MGQLDSLREKGNRQLRNRGVRGCQQEEVCKGKSMVGHNQCLSWISNYFFQFNRVMSFNFYEDLLKVFCRSLW